MTRGQIIGNNKARFTAAGPTEKFRARFIPPVSFVPSIIQTRGNLISLFLSLSLLHVNRGREQQRYYDNRVELIVMKSRRAIVRWRFVSFVRKLIFHVIFTPRPCHSLFLSLFLSLSVNALSSTDAICTVAYREQ